MKLEKTMTKALNDQMSRLIICFLIFGCHVLFAQTVFDYFVSEKGMQWKYDYYQLDSLQNKIAPTKPAYEYTKLLWLSPIISRDIYLFQTAGTIVDTPPVYIDTVAYETFPKPFSQFFSPIQFISGTPFDTVFVGSLNRFSNWYQIMNLQGRINIPDTLLRFDTTVTIDTLTLPFQFIFTTTKRNERTIIVPAGTFVSLPFDIRFRLNLLFAVPILGTIPVPIIDITDTMYIAKGKWIVKEIRRSATIPTPSLFSQLLPPKIPRFNLPGFVKELSMMTLTSVEKVSSIPLSLILSQNYPNPFNPSTTIQYQIPVRSNVFLKVFNILGQEVAELVNETKDAGTYSVQFDASSLASGLYFYQLRTGNIVETKKMLLIQ